MKTADRGVLKTKLGVSGFTVDVACWAGDAVAALELVNYDAAVLDLGLPDGGRARCAGGGAAHWKRRYLF